MIIQIPRRRSIGALVLAVALTAPAAPYLQAQDGGGAADAPPRQLTDIKDELEGLARDGDAAGLAAALDEAAAIDLIQTLKIAARAEYVIEGTVVAGRWRPGAGSAPAAFKSAVGSPPSSYRDHLLFGIVNDWVKRDPSAVREAISTLPDDGQRSDLHGQFNLAMVRFRPADALTSAIAEPGESGGIKIRDAALALVKSDLSKAVEILDETPTDLRDERTTLVAAIAGRWVESDPKKAAAWAAKLAIQHERATAYEEIAYRWAKQDVNSCGAWSEKLPAGETRDAALRALVFEASATEPGKAFAWGLLVIDPGLKETLLATAVSGWVTAEPEAAAAAVESAPLSNDEKVPLRDLLD